MQVTQESLFLTLTSGDTFASTFATFLADVLGLDVSHMEVTDLVVAPGTSITSTTQASITIRVESLITPADSFSDAQVNSIDQGRPELAAAYTDVWHAKVLHGSCYIRMASTVQASITIHAPNTSSLQVQARSKGFTTSCSWQHTMHSISTTTAIKSDSLPLYPFG